MHMRLFSSAVSTPLLWRPGSSSVSMPSLQRIAHNCPGLAVWASRGAVRASRKGPNTFSFASSFPKCCQPSISCAGCRPIPGCGSPSLYPEGHSRRLVIGLVGLGVGLLIGADLLLLIVACKILRFPASSGPFGLFYSIGGCSTVTLGPNGLFYQGSRGGMYKQTLRTALPSPVWHGGWTRSRGRLGRPSPRWNAGPRGPVSSWGWANDAARGAPDTWGSWAWWLVALRGEAWLVIPRWNAGPPKRNGQRFRVGPFPHGFWQTTP